jgi:hypothetical protein
MAGLDPSPPGRPKAKYNGSAPASEDRACRRAGALRSWTEFGASALLARGRLLDRFGFSWTIAVLPRTARKQGLDFLGFPWILSFESRLFNGLRRICGGRKFLALFCRWGGGAGTGSRYSYDAETQSGSSSKPNPVSLFCNQLPSTEIVDSLLSPDGALSRIIGDNQRYLAQSPTPRESLNLGTE